MKRLITIVLCIVFLCGCHDSGTEMDGAIALRQKVSAADVCEFECTVTADYSEMVYTFSMDCHYEKNGNMRFTVISPDTISGLSGKIDRDGGKLTFDDQVLAFPILAEGQISPVSAPWHFINALLGGYIRACGRDGDKTRIVIDDTYGSDPLQVDIWLDDQLCPDSCEFLWQGKRILSLEVKNFSYM